MLIAPRQLTIGALTLVSLVASASRGVVAMGEVPDNGPEAAPRQPLSSNIFLPVARNEPPEMFLPGPVASLGRVVRDVEWIDGVLYAAIGPNVVAFEAQPGADLKFIAQTEPLPGVVLDLAAGDGVVYAAHVDPWGSPISGLRDIGGLAVVSLSAPRQLLVTGRLALTDAFGYGAVAASGNTLVALRCGGTSRWNTACEALDVIDASRPHMPSIVRSVPVDRRALQWEEAGVAALGAGVFSNGWSVLDASDPHKPAVIAPLEEPGHPAAGGSWLATVDGQAVHLYRTGDRAGPQLLSSMPVGRLGLENGTTAVAVMDDGVLVSGPATDPEDGLRVAGRRVWLPASADGLGEPVIRDDELLPLGYSRGSDEIWIAMNPASVQWSVGLDPFTPSIGRLTLSGDGPAERVVTAWTGWDWRTLDVVVVDTVGYVLTYRWGGETAVSLLVYDLKDPRRPSLIGNLLDVCTSTGQPSPIESYRDCSAVPLDSDRLLVSSAAGATLIDVSSPEAPTVVERGPSLGSQLTAVPGGVLATVAAGTWNDNARDRLVMYETSGPDWPTLRWESLLVLEPFKMVASPAGDATLIAVVGWDDGPSIGLWTAWLHNGGSPTGATLTHSPQNPVWQPMSLVAQQDRLFLVRALEGWRVAAESTQPVGPTSLEVYRVTAAGPVLESQAATSSADEMVYDAVMANGIFLVGRETHIDFVRIDGAAGPRWLGGAAYADGLPMSDEWQDIGLTPRLVPIGTGHFYVTSHTMSEVWAFP